MSFLFYISKLLYVTVISNFLHSFSFSPRRFVFQTEISGKNIVLVLISLQFYFFSSLRRGDQFTAFCMNPRSNRKPAVGQRLTLIKHMTSTNYKLEPTIWSRGTGQRITFFDRCQLILTRCHISKSTR